MYHLLQVRSTYLFQECKNNLHNQVFILSFYLNASSFDLSFITSNKRNNYDAMREEMSQMESGLPQSKYIIVLK